MRGKVKFSLQARSTWLVIAQHLTNLSFMLLCGQLDSVAKKSSQSNLTVHTLGDAPHTSLRMHGDYDRMPTCVYIEAQALCFLHMLKCKPHCSTSSPTRSPNFHPAVPTQRASHDATMAAASRSMTTAVALMLLAVSVSARCVFTCLASLPE